jgi:hypothetical protein
MERRRAFTPRGQRGTMDKIVNIEKRIEGKRKKEQVERHREKIDAVQRVVQCSSCHFRCAMCGFHVGSSASPDVPLSLSFSLTLCGDCRREFDDFLSTSEEKKASEVFWHNREWLNMWAAWLSYRKAMAAFINSKEFKLLLEEIDAQP